MSRLRAQLSSSVLALVCFAAIAQERELLVLPSHVSASEAVELARAALAARGWRVESSDASSVVAANQGSRIRLQASDRALRYVDLGPPSGQRGDKGEERLIPVPQARIAELRADLAAALGADVAPAAARAAPSPPVVSAMAGEVLIDDVPAGLSDAQVSSVVRTALAGRRWVVQPDEDGAVVARLRRGLNNTTLKVFREGSTLRYIDSSRIRVTQDPTDVPDRWLNNLRTDLRKGFAGVRLTQSLGAQARRPVETASPPPAAAPGSAAERLRTLKQLLDAGAITPSEYESKRAEILRGL